METNCEYISYESTGYFSKVMIDYVQGDEKLQSFYKHPASIEGIRSAISARAQFETPRAVLVEALREQYKDLTLTGGQEHHLQLLLQPDTYTVCTAHQPNIFTGPLYFIYKILHAIKLADELCREIPGKHFVPVFYMGSEDADLDELGHINLEGEKLEWQTKQTGAVGRMQVDPPLIALIDRIAGQIGITKDGKELTALFRNAYRPGSSIQHATLQLVHELFKDFGLLVLVPDNAVLKAHFNGVVKRELLEQFSHPLVEATSAELSVHYKPQASGRELNLFYLTETRRERIQKEGDRFMVPTLNLSWSTNEMLAEVDAQPERFSGNVILRGLFQESILPNIAFIGGGGEIAYWLELKRVFEAAGVPYPVLVVRNSFLLATTSQHEAAEKHGFRLTDFFKPAEALVNQLVKRDSKRQLSLQTEKERLIALYADIRKITGNIDNTLAEHTDALKTRALDKVNALERKMLRAEKRKYEAQRRQINKLRQELFPGDSLQERQENMSSFYARFGKDLLTQLYQASPVLEQQFTILTING